MVAAIMTTLMLRVTNLTRHYGEATAVSGVDFTVHAGEIVGLLGPNGAGKTTTINMILGVLAPSAGTIHIHDINLATQPAAARAHANFAAVYAPLPGNLTVEQNLRFFGMLYDVHDLAARITELINEYDLARHRYTRCGLLSSGEQTRVALAKAMLNRPSLLLLDEPTASLDPATARDLRGHIQRFVRGDDVKRGVLWTSHNMQEVEAMCDRVLFLSHGKILLEGNPKTLAAEHGAENLEALFIRLAREPLNREAA